MMARGLLVWYCTIYKLKGWLSGRCTICPQMGYIFVYQWTTGVAILGKETYYCLEIFGFFKPYLYICITKSYLLAPEMGTDGHSEPGCTGRSQNRKGATNRIKIVNDDKIIRLQDF